MDHLTHSWPLRAGRRIWLVAALGLIAALGLLSLLDTEVMHFARELPAEVVVVFGWITRLGESDYILLPSLAGLAVAALAAALARGPIKRGLWQLAALCGFVFAGVGLPGLATAIVKRVIGRPRPGMGDTGALDFRTFSWVDWTHQSFPSGHATTAFAACFVVAFVWPRTYPFMLAFAAVVALSRIGVGAHYPTDLVAGAVIGVLGAYLVRNVFAARGWLFARVADGRIVRQPFDGLSANAGRPRS